jgi:hypothetical protein
MESAIELLAAAIVVWQLRARGGATAAMASPPAGTAPSCPSDAAKGSPRPPPDEQLGVGGQGMSPGLRKMTARAAAAVPFGAAARLISELAGITLTGKRAGRRAEADGTAAAAVTGARSAAVAARQVILMPGGDPPDKLYIAIDGTGVPMVAAETDGRDGKGEDGKAHTREVKMAVAFTQATVDEEGFPVRDPASSSYLATFAPAAGFGTLMAAEAYRRGAERARQLTILGDGAAWIWNLAAQHFPAATQIVDLFHAREHLHELANLAARLLGDHKLDWLAARLAELDAGDIPALLAAGRDLKFIGSLATERDKALAYCRVEVTGCPVTSPSGPGMHVPVHTAQASHEGSQVLCSRVRPAMAAGLRRLQSA